MKCGVLVAIEKKEANRIGMYICYNGNNNNGIHHFKSFMVLHIVTVKV